MNFMQCGKCNQEMAKKAVMTSGNSRFQKWQCGSCYTEKTEALGLVGGMPDFAK